MPRVNYVKHARARFQMVPKLGDDGQPVVVPVTRKNGDAKTTKRGKEITRTLTVQDRTKPLPNYKCGKCGTEILPGMPYKWIEPKMRGLMVRCMDCPTWQPWEYSYSLSARIAEIQSNATDALAGDFDSPDDLKSILEEIAGEIRSLAEEKEEAASNMEEGFGHSTYQSDELNDQAEQLNGWADDVENTDIPDLPEPDNQCMHCEGTGTCDAGEECAEGHECTEEQCGNCGGTGEAGEEEPTDDQMNEWREEARQAAQDTVDNCPL